MRENTTDFQRLFLEDVPMMDVRAPVEFNKGAFPGVVNLPLMDDRERERVGTAYKQHGQQAAIELGHRLVAGPLKLARVEAWTRFVQANPEGFLYCFRGGLRSQVTQQWIKAETGLDFPRVIGGYKALRTYLIEQTEDAVAQSGFVCLGGMTGIGKTEVLGELDNAVDLEALANHRGSGFGKRATAQPAPITFENRLAIDLLKRRARGQQGFVVEDESRMIGSCALPLSLFRRMQQSPLVWLEDSFDSRVSRILRDYVVDLCAEFVALHGEEAGFTAFAQRLRQSLAGIAKRLGGERYQRLAAILDQALQVQAASGRVDSHRAWIETLLKEYYDPMYVFQRDAKGQRIEFAGQRAEVVEYLRQRPGRG
ncbi:tRNA 2-selenouridine(34) synthase MnmH [Pseudomonas sp. DC3200b2]|uniref:tRNA 2-selenouridine(34) synthase MnmH n=1 Tax=Pseudomonas sp. DC3200b2 TaxID=2804669 RepID=UPI003CF469CC